MSAGARVSLEILQSWGVTSSRQPSGCTVDASSSIEDSTPALSSPASASSPSSPAAPVVGKSTEHLYDIALGPSVVRWDVVNQKRLLQFQAHGDIITGLLKSPDGKLIATSCDSGEVKLWTSRWVGLSEVTAPMTSQHYIAWSDDSQRLLVVGNGRHSSLVVYRVSRENGGNHKLELSWTLQAATDSDSSSSEKMAEEDADVGADRSGKNYPYPIAYCMAEFNPNGTIFAVKELPYDTALVQLVSLEGSVLRSVDLMRSLNPPEEFSKRPVQTLFMSPCRGGVYAVGLQGGKVAILDAEDLTIKTSFTAGTGFRTCLWDGDLLLLPCDSGKLTWWNVGGEKEEELHTGVRDLVSHVSLSASGNGIWICGSNMSFFELVRSSEGTVSSIVPVMGVHAHDITSVGIGFSPSGENVGSGDLLGSVWVTRKESIDPLHTCTVDGSVRCLCWISEDHLVMGTLTGHLYCWMTSEPSPVVIQELDGSIICVHLNHQRNVLAVGTSTGDLVAYSVELASGHWKFAVLSQVKAHEPHSGPQDKRFGQLGKQAEVWNLCWSPDDGRLATCSEDQTVKVWDTKTWESLVKLTGHVLAVTSVGWILLEDRSLLASCSDDRTVRLYDGDSYVLLDVVDTKDILGWHTLTYLTFFSIKDIPMLACTTQNGHVVLWKVNTSGGEGTTSPSDKQAEKRLGHDWLERQWKGKLHLGSIEGLAWQNHAPGGPSLVTVGGDCIVNLFRFNVN